MKFGLSLTGMLQQPAGTDMAGAVDDAVGLVRLARELGFSWLYAGQHFLSHPYQMLQPLPVMARLAAEAPGLDLVATAVLPLHHPVEVAEQVATLDVVSGGHAVLATALGYRDEENDAFGVPRRDRVGRMTEALEVIDLLWRERGPRHVRGRTLSASGGADEPSARAATLAAGVDRGEQRRGGTAHWAARLPMADQPRRLPHHRAAGRAVPRGAGRGGAPRGD